MSKNTKGSGASTMKTLEKGLPPIKVDVKPPVVKPPKEKRQTEVA